MTPIANNSRAQNAANEGVDMSADTGTDTDADVRVRYGNQETSEAAEEDDAS
jgi:hypothetical protein